MEFETSLSSLCSARLFPQAAPARASIEHPDSGELHDPEKSAIAEMDAAINELESVVNDGCAPGDHPRLDSHKRWIAHFNEAAKRSGAHGNVQKENHAPGARREGDSEHRIGVRVYSAGHFA